MVKLFLLTGVSPKYTPLLQLRKNVDRSLVDIISYDKHFKVHHGKNKFVRGKSHINGIESFWSYAKIRLVKFRGIDKKSFNLHLKECEFRFNHKG